MRGFLAAVLVAGVFLAGVRAHGVNPDEILADRALEQRARDISGQLRCLVCQNQSIDDSNAPLARDLRILVRERLQAGDSDREIIDFVVARYGEFVLLSPRFGPRTLALWLGPAVLLVIGAGVVIARLRRRRVIAAAEPLSEDEEKRLRRALEAPH